PKTAEQAAKILVSAMTKTTDASVLLEFADHVAALAPRMKEEARVTTCTSVAKLLVERITNPAVAKRDSKTRREWGEVFKALTTQIEPGVVGKDLTDAMKKTPESVALTQLAQVTGEGAKREPSVGAKILVEAMSSTKEPDVL